MKRLAAIAVMLVTLPGCAEFRVVYDRAADELTATDVISTEASAYRLQTSASQDVSSLGGLMAAEWNRQRDRAINGPVANVYQDSGNSQVGAWGNGRLNYTNK